MPPCSVHAVGQPGVDAEVHAVPGLGLLAEVAGERRVVVGGHTELRRVQVVEPADHVAAAVGQPRIDRRRDAVGIEVGRACWPGCRSPRSCRTSGGSSRRRCRARGISSCCTLVENSALHGRLPQPKRVSSLNAGIDDSAPKLAGPAPHSAVGRHAQQVAVHDVVAATRVAHGVERMSFHDRCRLRGDAGRVADRRGRHHVPAQVHLQRRLAVAEEVVGGGDARRDVLEVVPRDRVEVVVAGRLVERRAERLLRVAADVLVVAQAQVQREPLDRPAVLDEEADLADHLRARAAFDRRVLRELRRHAVGEAVEQRRRVGLRRAARQRPRVGGAHLERVRAGDVRHRRR